MESIRIDKVVYLTKDFEGPLDIPGKAMYCPQCDAFHPVSSWTAYEVPCESCGGHPILGCPEHHHYDPFTGDSDAVLPLKDL